VTAFHLPFTPPLAADALLAGVAAHAVPGLESVDIPHRTVTRILSAPAGPARLTVTFRTEHIESIVDGSLRDIAAVTGAVRRWLDLDADAPAIDSALRRHSRLAPLVAGRPGLRVLGTMDGYELAVTTVLGQQVSLARARALAGRLVTTYGIAYDDGVRAFPPAELLAGVPMTDLRSALGIPNARARAVTAVAQAVADGLRITPDADHSDVRRRLSALPGIGPWTVDYLTVRALGDRDAFVPGDLVLRRALGGISTVAAEAMSERWRPYRAYALFHLWTQAAYG
jgi:DNA-3-methyladenine glycosylase II/AraC family transcriptional regulator of adaptative response / DNA-3-methyladenine glycosylase II